MLNVIIKLHELFEVVVRTWKEPAAIDNDSKKVLNDISSLGKIVPQSSILDSALSLF